MKAMWFSVLLIARLLFMASSSQQMQCHIKPFGCHKPPSIQVDQFNVEDSPSPKEFFSKYVKQSTPVIFRSAIKQSVAFKSWTDDYIQKNFGEMEVRLEAKHEKSHLPPKGHKYLGRDTLGHFVQTYHEDGNNVYVVSDLPDKMYKDVLVIPSFGACGEVSRSIVEVDLWWSGGGTSSIIHKDAYHQINCLVNGTKQWKLIDSKYEKYLYKHPEPSHELGGFSDIDPSEVDLIEHPDVVKTEWSQFLIHAGDCLFLPKGYYHQVDSFGTNNLAVSLLFSRFDGNALPPDFSDCKDPINMEITKSLADYEVQWKWKGSGVMVMGRHDLEQKYRLDLAHSVNAAEKEGRKVDSDELLEIIEVNFPIEDQGFRYGNMSNVFTIINKNKDRFITSEEIAQLTSEDLRTIANEIEPYEPSATYLLEYSIIPFEQVWTTLKICLSKHSVISENLWLTYYKALGGTDDFGKEIYERLGNGKNAIKREDVTEDDIWRSVENWVKYWATQYSSLSEKPMKQNDANVWYTAGTQELLENQVLTEDKIYKTTSESTKIREEL